MDMVWYIDLYMYHKKIKRLNVGKYNIPMDPMGYEAS